MAATSSTKPNGIVLSTRYSISGAIVAIFIGTLVLLINFHKVPPEPLITLVQFWPVIFILTGIETILSRFVSNRSHTIGIALITIITLSGITLYSWKYSKPLDSSSPFKYLFTSPQPYMSSSPIPIMTPINNLDQGSGRVIQSSPKYKVTSDDNVNKNFAMVYNMIQAYYAKTGDLPVSLDNLANGYFTGTVPINDTSGQPFYYQSFVDNNGNRTKFILCLTDSKEASSCYSQYVQGHTY